MEVVVTAIIGDLAGRSISFLVDRYLNRTASNTGIGSGDDDVDRLHRLLLRLHIIVEEAEQRRITNRAMLRQLDALREEMYRGHHALDTASRHRRGHHKHEDHDGGAVSRSFASNSQSSPAKRIRLMIRSTSTSSSRPRRGEERRRLQQVVARLETAIADVKDEFVVFLVACPPVLPRQPYSVHMVLDKCMFGRQMEMERVVAFLLQAEEECGDNDGTHQKLGILPIVGPRRTGKTTLVEHACNDERVREHFSQIVSFTLGDLRDEEETIASSLRSGRVIRNQQRHASSDDDDHEGSKVLVIVELDGDRNSKGLDGSIMVDLFGRFCSMCRSRTPCVSKIIVTSRSDKIIASLGTTEPLRLDYLTQEAYWYFFKVRVFGSIDASEHPEMVSIALDMAAETNRCFAVVDAFGGLLRSNFNARFWRLTLAVLREIIKKQQLFMNNMNDARYRGPNAEVPKQEFGPKISEKLVYHEDYQIGSVQGEVPKISLQDIIFGGARPKGRFDVLGWKSSIPPYHTYAYSCEIQRRP
jgi:hypothetical protein